jgi:hypothetical protein
MDAITIFTKNYYPLHERWLNTLPVGFTPLVFEFITNETVFGFRTKSWYDAIEFKLISVLNTLNLKPDDEIILVSDSDIYFIKNDDTLITLAKQTFIKNEHLDLWIMQENNTKNRVNTGFYFIKNSASVRSFLESAIRSCQEYLPYADQSFFNKNLNLLNIEFIPNKYVIWATNIFNKNYSIFHHAVYTGNVEQKLRQQNFIISQFI